MVYAKVKTTINTTKLKTSVGLNILLFIVMAVAAHGVLWLADNNYPPFTGETYFHFKTNQKIVALTYDDGPCPPFTDSILEILKINNVKTTFFLVGKELQRSPEYLCKIAEQNHEIGNHSWSHEKFVLRTPRYMKKEILRTDSIINFLGYNQEIHFRAPHSAKLIELPYVLSKIHKTNVLFDVVPIDWENRPISVMLQRAITSTRPGSIILLHDGGGDRSSTVKLSEQLITALKDKGYKFATVSELIRLTKTHNFNSSTIIKD